MQNINFYKYQGAGNDFVMIDNRSKSVNLLSREIAALCDRHKGIGADGLMMIEETDGYDFRMVYFNSDGSEADMCGNGARCIALFAHHLGIGGEEKYFIAADGGHRANIVEINGKNGVISIEMIPIKGVEELSDGAFCLNSGVPHYVRFCDTIDDIDIDDAGSIIRYDSRFADIGGVNVNFVSRIGNMLYIRTYERGVEGETLACGTGSVAAAVAAHYSGRIKADTIKVKALGGELEIKFNADYSNVLLTGGASFVFRGNIGI